MPTAKHLRGETLRRRRRTAAQRRHIFWQSTPNLTTPGRWNIGSQGTVNWPRRQRHPGRVLGSMCRLHGRASGSRWSSWTLPATLFC